MGAGTIEVTGSRQVQVTCEKCRYQYEYTLKRTGVAATGLLSLSKAEAEQKALLDLSDSLKAGCDVVPCPQCGALTAEMQRQEAANREMGAVFLYIGLFVFGAGALITWLLAKSSHKIYFLPAGIAIVGVCFVFKGLGAMLTGRMKE